MYQREERRMWTEVTITIFWDIYDVEDIDYAFGVFGSLEQEFSRFDPTSSLSQLNIQKRTLVSNTFIDVLRLSKEFYKESNGYFNPLIDLKGIWYSRDFQTKEFVKEPGGSNLDLEQVMIEGNQVTLRSDQVLDLWGIVKGYAVDRVKDFLESKGYKNYIIDAGGDIFCAWVDDHGGPLVVGIDSPYDDTLRETASLSDQAICTSGTYKRKRTIDGEEHHHIINPHTWQNPDDIISITIIAQSCCTADVFATACIAMWREKAALFLEQRWLKSIVI